MNIQLPTNHDALILAATGPKKRACDIDTADPFRVMVSTDSTVRLRKLERLQTTSPV